MNGVNSCNISKSLKLLKTHTVTEVGYICGFCDSSHFVSIFKKHTGTTPMQTDVYCVCCNKKAIQGFVFNPKGDRDQTDVHDGSGWVSPY